MVDFYLDIYDFSLKFLKTLRENEIIFLKEGGGGGVVVGDLSNTTNPLLIRHWTISNFMENSLGLKRSKEPGAAIQLRYLSIHIWKYCSCLCNCLSPLCMWRSISTVSSERLNVRIVERNAQRWHRNTSKTNLLSNFILGKRF